MSKNLVPSQAIAILSIVSLLSWVTLASAQTPGSQVPLKPLSPQKASEDQSIKTLVATVFGEPLYLEALTPAEAETQRKELPPQQFKQWLSGYQAARIYDKFGASYVADTQEREKINVSDEELAALTKSVEQNRNTIAGGPDDSPFPSLEEGELQTLGHARYSSTGRSANRFMRSTADAWALAVLAPGLRWMDNMRY